MEEIPTTPVPPSWREESSVQHLSDRGRKRWEEPPGTHQKQRSTCSESGGHPTPSKTLLEAPSDIKQGPLPQIKPWHPAGI